MKKINVILISLLTTVFCVLTPTTLVFAETANFTDTQTIISQLKEQIKTLQNQVDDLKVQLVTAQVELKLDRNLHQGLSGNDVKQLQEFLKQFPDIYPEGLVTGYYGPLTETAVKKLQEKNGIESVGSVGPKTLAKINTLITDGAGSSDATSTSSATVVNQTPTTTASTENVTDNIHDVTAPVRSNASPSYILSSTSTSTKVSLSTSEPAYCYWSNTPNTPFDYMSAQFTNTGGTSHSMTVQTSPGVFAYYVRCRDQALNANTSDYPVFFSVAGSMDSDASEPPRISMASPTNGDTVTEGLINFEAMASDNTGVVGVQFYLNSKKLGEEKTLAPFVATTTLTRNSYTVVAVARDLSGNYATSSTVNFFVKAKPVTEVAHAMSVATSTPSVTSNSTVTTTNVATASTGGATNTTTSASSATTTTTTAATDTTPPVISNIQTTSITATSATITWTTNESADSRNYLLLTSGATTGTASTTNYDPNLTTSHSMNLSGLDSSKTYYYVVVSKDSSGNGTTSSEQSFTTLAAPVVQASNSIDLSSLLPLRPWDVVTSGSDYVVTMVDMDHSTGRLVRVSRSGNISTIATFDKKIFGVTASGSDFIVTDGSTDVLKVSSDGTVTTIASGVMSNNFKSDIALNGSNFVVTDYATGRLLLVTPSGTISALGSGLGHINSVTQDGSNFVAVGTAANDNGTYYLYRVTPSGEVSTLASLTALGNVTKMGSYYYVDSGDNLTRISSDGTVSTNAKLGGGQVTGLTNDGTNVVATDYSNSKLLLVTPTALSVIYKNNLASVLESVKSLSTLLEQLRHFLQLIK